MISPETAFLYAGDFLSQADTDGCFFHLNDGRPISEAHRVRCIVRCDNILTRMGANFLVARPTGRTVERLRDLRSFFEETPLYTKAPLSEAGPLALRALQNIRSFLDDQTLTMDDPGNDWRKPDPVAPDGDHWSELASVILGESLSIVGPPAPRPLPLVMVNFEVNGNAEGKEFSSLKDAAEAARAWIMGIDLEADRNIDFRVNIEVTER